MSRDPVSLPVERTNDGRDRSECSVAEGVTDLPRPTGSADTGAGAGAGTGAGAVSSAPAGPDSPGAVLEHAVLDVRCGDEEAFEAAFSEARSIIASSPGFVSLRLERCVERPSRYLLLVTWTSLEAHTEGFRGSAAFAQWRSLLHHFYDPFPTVEHFKLVATA